MGTLLGTMCGFVSAVLLTPSQGESTGGLPAAPGVVSFVLGSVAVIRVYVQEKFNLVAAWFHRGKLKIESDDYVEDRS